MISPLRSPLRGACATASFVRLARHRAHRRWAAQLRWQSDTATATAPSPAQDDGQPPKSTLAITSAKARLNPIGVQQLSDVLYEQVFPRGSEIPAPPESLIELSRDHLQRHDLYGKATEPTEPIAFKLPSLQAPDTETLDEHFFRLGTDAAEPFLSYAKQFARSDTPQQPREWVRQSGWTKYYCQDGVGPETTERLEAPDETMLSFDVEVMWKENPFAVMACAVSPTAWYVWLSPWLLGETDVRTQLVPLGDPTKDRIIVGHNIGYDRARILEEYDIKQTRNCFLDTMSLHVAVNGMCSQQRPTWMKAQKNREEERIARAEGNFDKIYEEELWVGRSSINSLRDVAKFHLNVAMDKSARDDFSGLDREKITERLDDLLNYCAADVAVTHRVFSIVFTNFLKTCPHPVSFAALRHLSSVILPVDESWKSYLLEAEEKYQELSVAVQERLITLAEKALEIKDDKAKWSSDPWLKQLDWSGQEIRWVKEKGKDGKDKLREAKNQKMPGKPKWYKDLFTKDVMNISVRTRIAPLLLRLSWDGHPLVWSDEHGWTFRVPLKDKEDYIKKSMTFCRMTDEKTDPLLRDDIDGAYFKVPHKDGPTARCANPMAKSYLGDFESEILTSEYAYAKEALEMNASCSYWISARERIRSQLVVWEKELQVAKGQETAGDSVRGYILPQVIPMGTVTRRAVENTWLTASNAKKNRVGSELKAMVKAPPGYSFVGADVDSEELWIASLLGDAVFQLHGGNAIGFMTLEGSKAAGTDLHSRTAGILGISRNHAKVFNYGRIYGAGLKFASQLLRQFNPSLTEQETYQIATKLYTSTKGAQSDRKLLCKRKFWRGGTESFVFNKLEEFAEQRHPRTPVLGAGITEALMSSYVRKGGFLTSRINWAIQSSGVDYLHLLIVSMDYLTRRFNIDARLAISVHDEIRYLVKSEDNYRAAMALQVANIWTRCMFAQQIGIHDLPQTCAFFSAVDIDHVLRKEVDMPCITPSHRTAIPPGESIDIHQLLDKGNDALLDEAISPKNPPQLDQIEYVPRASVMQKLREEDASTAEPAFIKAQITSDIKELTEICAERRKEITPQQPKKEPTPRPYNFRPYASQARLMPMTEPLLVSEAFRANQAKHFGGNQKKVDWYRTNKWTKIVPASRGVSH
ncbi:DNA polymerase gamma [Diaporthe helianthi]|uniref:DNA-directed DNA polymerase n=1 Tax=Diaporthe helianthi TaxID=158607 RepID=A0A2P5ID62_DIAHE|nr:DNA polymerase gamma [Diaporthe helianthi]